MRNQNSPSSAASRGVERGAKRTASSTWRFPLAHKVKRDDPRHAGQTIDFERTTSCSFEVVATVSFITDDNQERSVVLSTLQLAPRARAVMPSAHHRASRCWRCSSGPPLVAGRAL